jgi:hypothetical protein
MKQKDHIFPPLHKHKLLGLLDTNLLPFFHISIHHIKNILLYNCLSIQYLDRHRSMSRSRLHTNHHHNQRHMVLPPQDQADLHHLIVHNELHTLHIDIPYKGRTLICIWTCLLVFHWLNTQINTFLFDSAQSILKIYQFPHLENHWYLMCQFYLSSLKIAFIIFCIYFWIELLIRLPNKMVKSVKELVDSY